MAFKSGTIKIFNPQTHLIVGIPFRCVASMPEAKLISLFFAISSHSLLSESYIQYPLSTHKMLW